MGAPAVVSGRMKDNACSWQLRAPYRIALCALALATIMMVTCNLTKDIPSLPESDASTDMQILMQVQEDMEAADDDSSFLYNQGSSSLRNQDGVKKFFKKQIDTALTKMAKGKTGVAKKTKINAKRVKANDASKATMQKALQAAANAKIEAMAQQRKAIRAASRAKEAAAKAANAPMNKRGHDIVKKAQNTARDSAMAGEAAKAAVRNLMRKKAKASKAILDAAGGKYMKETGYQGQGGYFGAALKTAFHNGQLSERLKYRDWKKSTVRASATLAFKRGEKTGFQKGFIKGEKRGEIKVLPKAVRKAEHLLAKRKKAIEKIAKRRRKSEKAAALKAAVAKEADKVRKKLKVTRTSASESESALKEFSEEEEEDLEN